MDVSRLHWQRGPEERKRLVSSWSQGKRLKVKARGWNLGVPNIWLVNYFYFVLLHLRTWMVEAEMMQGNIKLCSYAYYRIYSEMLLLWLHLRSDYRCAYTIHYTFVT
ncbi:uncharacterized protein LOC131181553 isoform X2 [Hevea brasiliensis]|uniref:uncharacterized protein LOC131181553 isoform X2 n=1 Tax=Hevea brasiliensis TaxID=3981 RepID=UPI0025D56D5E|nr:uncharacterized protein LOC131181553 isoform X2 [Hevea brasiliensis]